MLLQKHLPCYSPFWWERRPSSQAYGAVTGDGQDKEEVTHTGWSCAQQDGAAGDERGADQRTSLVLAAVDGAVAQPRTVLVLLAAQRQVKSKSASSGVLGPPQASNTATSTPTSLLQTLFPSQTLRCPCRALPLQGWQDARLCCVPQHPHPKCPRQSILLPVVCLTANRACMLQRVTREP